MIDRGAWRPVFVVDGLEVTGELGAAAWASSPRGRSHDGPGRDLSGDERPIETRVAARRAR